MVYDEKYCIHDYVNVVKLIIYILKTLIRIIIITLELKEERHKNKHLYLRN